MKKKKPTPQTPQLYKLETGIKRPVRGTKPKSKETLKLEELLRTVTPGYSFLIKKKQEATVRRFVKENNLPYHFYISATDAGIEFRRVFCEAKKEKKNPKK